MGTIIEELNPKIRRVIALAIDILFVVTIGAIIGTILKPFLINHSNTAYYIGFAIAWLYHSLANSLLKEGQSAGKILVGLKVTDKNGKRIGVIRSLLRSFPIVFCFFGEPSKTADLRQEILTYVVTPLWISLAYFAVFLPCCRTTHDFMFGTFISDIKNKMGCLYLKFPIRA